MSPSTNFESFKQTMHKYEVCCACGTRLFEAFGHRAHRTAVNEKLQEALGRFILEDSEKYKLYAAGVIEPADWSNSRVMCPSQVYLCTKCLTTLKDTKKNTVPAFSHANHLLI